MYERILDIIFGLDLYILKRNSFFFEGRGNLYAKKGFSYIRVLGLTACWYINLNTHNKMGILQATFTFLKPSYIWGV